MIKKDIVEKASEKITEEPRVKIQQAVDKIFDEMKNALLKGEKIELRGFGVFEIRPRKTGIGRNPKTGATVNITPGKKVKFRPGKKMLEL
jgi:DNA-binding protein HU-beta